MNRGLRSTGAGLALVCMASLAHGVAAEERVSASRRDVFVRGAPLGSTNGVVCDAQDRLLIASVRGRYVKVMDTTTGEILKTYGAEQGVHTPDDVAVAPDGTMYWTNILNGDVGRLDPNGQASAFALGPGVNAVRVAPDGAMLYVSKAILGDAFYAIDLRAAGPPRLLAENVGWPNSMAFGPDGRLYSALNLYGEIVRWDLETGATETVVRGLEFPSAVKFDSKGRMLVTELLRGEVLRIDPATGAKTLLAALSPGLDNLAVDSHDRIFVSSNLNGGIVEILDNRTTRVLSPPGMLPPSGVAVVAGSEGDTVYVGDLSTLRAFDGESGAQQTVAYSGFHPPGPPAAGRTYTLNKSGVATIDSTLTVSADGNRLILSSWFGNVVQIYDPTNGRVVQTFRDFQVPMNAIGFQGDLLVAELGTRSVVRRSAATGERTTLAAGLPIPTGLAATADAVWVAEWVTGRVLQIVADGQVLAEPIEVAAELQQPEGMAVAPDGGLLVVEAGAGRLLHINPTTKAVTVLATDLGTGVGPLPGFPPTQNFSSVAIGADGTLYVSCDRSKQIVRLRPR